MNTYFEKLNQVFRDVIQPSIDRIKERIPGLEKTMSAYFEKLNQVLHDIIPPTIDWIKEKIPNYWDSITFGRILAILAAVTVFLIYLFKEELIRKFRVPDDKKNHDKALWEKENQILSERLLFARLDELESSTHAVHTDLVSQSEKLTHFLEQEKDSYISKKLQKEFDAYIANLKTLTSFVDEHFWFDPENQTEQVTLHPDDYSESRLGKKTERYIKAEKDLYPLIHKTKDSYQKYRDLIKSELKA